MWNVSSIIALAPAYIRRDHLLSATGRGKAFKALSAPFLNPSATVLWLQFLRTNDLARRLGHRSPQFLVKPLTRYLNVTYQFADRVRALISHYEFVRQQFTKPDLDVIYFGAGITLAEFFGKSGTSYRVVLSTYSDAHNEGEMVLKIETSRADIVCFVIFSIGSGVDGSPQIELGAIQGARRDHPDLSKIATKDFHSMRPSHLLMAIVYSFSSHCKIDAIACVSTQAQVNRSNPAFRTHYDPLWEELGGQPNASGFYMLPQGLSHRHGPKQQSKHPRRHRMRTELKTDIARMMQDRLSGRPQ